MAILNQSLKFKDMLLMHTLLLSKDSHFTYLEFKLSKFLYIGSYNDSSPLLFLHTLIEHINLHLTRLLFFRHNKAKINLENDIK